MVYFNEIRDEMIAYIKEEHRTVTAVRFLI